MELQDLILFQGTSNDLSRRCCELAEKKVVFGVRVGVNTNGIVIFPQFLFIGKFALAICGVTGSEDFA